MWRLQIFGTHGSIKVFNRDRHMVWFIFDYMYVIKTMVLWPLIFNLNGP